MNTSDPASVTIVGAGRMATAIAHVLSRTRARLRVLARRRASAEALAGTYGAAAGVIGDPIEDDMVVFAVPHAATLDIAQQYEPALRGRIAVDASHHNVRSRSAPPHERTGTLAVQRLLPRTRVVKAFSTAFAEALMTDDPGEGMPVVLVAGNDALARFALVRMLHTADVAAVSVGSLEWAPELDAIAALQNTLAERGAVSRRGGFALRY